MARKSASELLNTPGAMLNTSHLYALGYSRSAADAIFQQVPIIDVPNHDRKYIRASDYKALLERRTVSLADRGVIAVR
jgi:hypothetical protein